MDQSLLAECPNPGFFPSFLNPAGSSTRAIYLLTSAPFGFLQITLTETEEGLQVEAHLHHLQTMAYPVFPAHGDNPIASVPGRRECHGFMVARSGEKVRVVRLSARVCGKERTLPDKQQIYRVQELRPIAMTGIPEIMMRCR
jgi:hypothetical protein